MKYKRKFTKRPWGEFQEFALNEKSTIKIIKVKPRQETSLQYHINREEMWYFITSGFIQIGKKRYRKKEGDEVWISKKMPHRLIAGKNELKILETSFGKFDEKDEIRLEDKYGRN